MGTQLSVQAGWLSCFESELRQEAQDKSKDSHLIVPGNKKERERILCLQIPFKGTFQRPDPSRRFYLPLLPNPVTKPLAICPLGQTPPDYRASAEAPGATAILHCEHA